MFNSMEVGLAVNDHMASNATNFTHRFYFIHHPTELPGLGVPSRSNLGARALTLLERKFIVSTLYLTTPF